MDELQTSECISSYLWVVKGRIDWSQVSTEMEMMQSICGGMHQKHKKVVIPYQKRVWCLIDKEDDITILKNIGEILEREEQFKIRQEARRWNAKLTFITINPQLFATFYTDNAWTREAYFRLAMFEFLPEDVDRALYLDVDVIAVNRIYDFYFSSFEGKEVIACTDMGSRIPFGDYRDVMFQDYVDCQEFQYCNSGVTLWNVAKLREQNMLANYLEIAEENQFQMKAPDQDLINTYHALSMKVCNPLQYNLFAHYVKAMSVDLAEQFVCMIHYSGQKPWLKEKIEYPLDEIWWKYARNISFYSESSV